MRDSDKALWERCVAFHGHACGGLAIGFQASLYAMELLGQTGAAADEEVVCVTENDACGVDAIQLLLGCTVGKGNLLFHLRGKQAFSFYNRSTGKSVRLVLRELPDMPREERHAMLRNGDCHDLFDVMKTTIALPERARNFQSLACARCGERTAESSLRVQDGKMVCEDCYTAYSRTV